MWKVCTGNEATSGKSLVDGLSKIQQYTASTKPKEKQKKKVT